MKNMGFVDAVKSVVVENYANFNGRARRSEYWYYTLASFIAGFICGLLPIPFIAPLLSLVLFIPGLAVSVRRLHDIGKSGWMYLLILIPLVGAIILLVWFCQDSQPGENKWGANPKE